MRKTIDELRRDIDQLDERLIQLLNERASCALEIGKLKHELGLEVYQPDREAEVVKHVQACGRQAGGPLGAEAIARLFERIIDEARRIERATALGGTLPDGNAGAEQAITRGPQRGSRAGDPEREDR
jgi:chorismate mutase-like protein